MLPAKGIFGYLVFGQAILPSLLCGGEIETAPAAVDSAPVRVVVTVALPLPGIVPVHPQYSPDGKWISFSGPRGDGIYVMRPDGSALRTLTDAPGSGYRHAWSPDSTQIVCRSRPRPPARREYVVLTVPIQSGEPVNRVAADAGLWVGAPFWQQGPGGCRWIAEAGIAGGSFTGPWMKMAQRDRPDQPTPPLLPWENGQLGFPDRTTGFRPLVAGRSMDPQWNRSGTRVVFDAADRIGFWDSSRPEAQILVSGQQPAISPDGQWICYQVTHDHTHDPDDPRYHLPGADPHLHDDRTNHRITESDIWIIRPDGTGAIQVTDTPDVLEVEPSWAPDGRSLVCRTEDGGELILLNLDAVLP